MTPTQERAITLSLNILQVGFFECPKHYYEYFIDNDEWSLLLTAADINATDTPPQQVAVAVLSQAVRRTGFFDGMSDFKAPAHYCSFLVEKVRTGDRQMVVEPCQEGQQDCPYATFRHLRDSNCGTAAGRKRNRTINLPVLVDVVFD